MPIACLILGKGNTKCVSKSARQLQLPKSLKLRGVQDPSVLHRHANCLMYIACKLRSVLKQQFKIYQKADNAAGGWVIVQDSTFTQNQVLGSGGGGMQIVNMGNIVVNGCDFQQVNSISVTVPCRRAGHSHTGLQSGFCGQCHHCHMLLHACMFATESLHMLWSCMKLAYAVVHTVACLMSCCSKAHYKPLKCNKRSSAQLQPESPPLQGGKNHNC